MKLHKYITVHIKKHQRRYLFWLWAFFGIGIMKIMLIIGVLWGITIFSQKCNVSAERLNMYEKAEIFHKVIYDIRNTLDKIQAEWNPYNMTGFEEFAQLHENFHNIENINAKFRIVKKLQGFFDEKDNFLHKVWYFESTGGKIQDEIYHQTIKIFNWIK